MSRVSVTVAARAGSAWGVALLLLLPAAAYLNSLQNPFHYDDVHSIVDNPHLRDLSSVPSYFHDPSMFSARPGNAMYRPLLLATFAVNHAVSGLQPWSYHLTGLALHLGCVYLLFRIGRMLLADEAAAWAAAALFALHPVNTETLNYVSSRSEVLAGLFLLLAVWLFLRPGDGWRRAAGLGGAYVGGLWSKEAAVALPAVLAAWDAVHGTWRAAGRLRLYSVLGAIAAAYLGLMTWGWGFLRRAVGAPVRPYAEQWWTQVKALVFYAKLLVWPTGLSVDHQFLISDSILDPYAASAALLVASLVGRCLWRRRQHPLPLFLLLWALIVLAPSTLVPLNVLVNEHRLYLPSACYSLTLAYAGLGWARRGRGWRRAITVGFVTVAVAYFATTWARNRVWSSELSLWSDAAAQAPLMARPHFYLGEALATAGRLPEAVAAFEHAVRRDQRFAPGYVRLAAIHQQQGDLDRAVQVLEQGIREATDRSELYPALAEAYRLRGQREARRDVYLEWLRRSVWAYEQALANGADDAAVRNNLGNCLQELGRPAEALVHHRRALAWDPRDPRTLVNLGSAHWSLGEVDSARQDFQQAVALDSVYAGAWYNLGLAQERVGDPDAARVAYQRAARLDPEYVGPAAARIRGLAGGRP